MNIPPGFRFQRRRPDTSLCLSTVRPPTPTYLHRECRPCMDTWAWTGETGCLHRCLIPHCSVTQFPGLFCSTSAVCTGPCPPMVTNMKPALWSEGGSSLDVSSHRGNSQGLVTAVLTVRNPLCAQLRGTWVCPSDLRYVPYGWGVGDPWLCPSVRVSVGPPLCAYGWGVGDVCLSHIPLRLDPLQRLFCHSLPSQLIIGTRGEVMSENAGGGAGGGGGGGVGGGPWGPPAFNT